ncbi:MAG TPA: hypothetical protein VFE82_17585 [Ramlibacter sp.]|jgi:hypothetical protein|uniref:hypothetical protein n=1 Tax=Ramlibacter sp. TaxID=1917967 RepID=UPI002D6C6AFC|nr:hypothetical protein [Ramlibacter sp.]HZY20286.1 hypothetical protein [Ramlibacter sp.]
MNTERQALQMVVGMALTSPVHAHGFGAAEIGFAAELVAFFALASAVFISEKNRVRAIFLVGVLTGATLLIWIIAFGLLGSIRGVVPSDGDIPLTLLVGLVGAAPVLVLVRRSPFIGKRD